MKARLHLGPTLIVLAGLACVPKPEPYVPEVEDSLDAKGIVGGQNASILDHPWQVSLRSTFGGAFCGGSVIDAEWVLTAAHCVEGTSAGSLRVVAGITRQSQASSGQVRPVAQILRYPGYTRPETGKDVALLRLSAPLDLGDAAVAAIPLVTPADAAAGLTAAGVTARVSGWGTLFSGGSTPDVLQVVEVPLVSASAAQSAYGSTPLTDDQLGAGVLGSGGRDSCQGDSGGPLTVPDAFGGRKLAGVVSWGFGCGSARYPGMYARVSSFTSWIEGYVRPSQAPTLTITSPTSGQTVQGTLQVTAAAADPDGQVARVVFAFPDGRTVEDATAPYAVSWDSTTFADGPGLVRAQAFDDRGAASAIAEVSIVTSNGNQSCASGTFAAPGLPVAIPDADTAGVEATIDVPSGGNIQRAQLSLQITHTYRSDLVVELISPAGTTITLSNRAGGSADDLVFNGLGLDAVQGEPADCHSLPLPRPSPTSYSRPLDTPLSVRPQSALIPRFGAVPTCRSVPLVSMSDSSPNGISKCPTFRFSASRGSNFQLM